MKSLKDLEERGNSLPFIFWDFVLKYLWCGEVFPGWTVSLILVVFRWLVTSESTETHSLWEFLRLRRKKKPHQIQVNKDSYKTGIHPLSVWETEQGERTCLNMELSWRLERSRVQLQRLLREHKPQAESSIGPSHGDGNSGQEVWGQESWWGRRWLDGRKGVER